jgi:hypothetical protein
MINPIRRSTMRTQATLSIIGAAAALGAGGIAAAEAATSSAATNVPARHVEGRVVAVNGPARTFTVRDVERGTLTVKVTSTTRYERIAGFSALRRSELIDVRATPVGGAWSASVVELSGRAAPRSGVDERHADDHGNDQAGHLEPGDDRSR